MFLNSPKSASGYYGTITKVHNSKNEDGTIFAFSPGEGVIGAASAITTDSDINEDYIYIRIPDGGDIAFFTIDTALGIQFALCSYSWDPGDGNGWKNEFVYILAANIDFSSIMDKLPDELTSINNINSYTNTIGMDDDREGNEHLGEAWIAIDDTWLMNCSQVMLNSCDQVRDYESMIADNIRDCYEKDIGKYTIVSVMNGYGGNNTIIDTIGPNDIEYLLIVYDGVYRYVKKSAFQKYDGSNPILNIWNEQHGSGIASNVRISTETIQVKEETCLMSPDEVVNWKGSHTANKTANNYSGIKIALSTVRVCAYEIINGTKFSIVYNGGFLNYYIPYNSLMDSTTAAPPNSYVEEVFPSPPINSNQSSGSSNSGTVNGNNAVNDYGTSNDFSVTESGGNNNQNNSSNMYSWYETTLSVGKYPDEEMNRLTGAAYLDRYPDTRLPSGWGDDTESLNDDLYYSLQRYSPSYLSKERGYTVDKRQITKINRFRFITDNSGLSTKSFIFMTKPDLNLYKLDENNVVIYGQMNPDLLRIPEFKYIGRNKDVGYDILDSLEYYGTTSGNTPWLSIITNQAKGYSPIDRSLTYTEVGETFHGHKVLYGKHDFKHNIAGTISIPFMERRDLSLYYTLKIWTEYIHNINIGLVEPHPIHMINKELDYAVSLYYIQTDETMENILYWEKLTGVFPLKCPDSFFDWRSDNPEKNMEYDIEFAYSMRSVLRTPDLFELDRLYMKGASIDVDTQYPVFGYNEAVNNKYIAKMAAYFNIERHDNIETEFGQKMYTASTQYYPESEEYNNFVNNILNGTNDISKYYYEPYYDSDKREVSKFLSNYSIYLHSHGIPYVTGPFVVPDPDYNGGKFLLKWV